MPGGSSPSAVSLSRAHRSWRTRPMLSTEPLQTRAERLSPRTRFVLGLTFGLAFLALGVLGMVGFFEDRVHDFPSWICFWTGSSLFFGGVRAFREKERAAAVERVFE